MKTLESICSWSDIYRNLAIHSTFIVDSHSKKSKDFKMLLY